MNRSLRLARMFAAIALFASCAPVQVDQTPVPYTELASGPSPTPILCTVNPAGLFLELQVLGTGHVRVVGSGFSSNEKVFISIQGDARLSDGTTAAQGREYQTTVDADGNYVAQHEFDPMEGPATWDVAVVHSRGVACASASSK